MGAILNNTQQQSLQAMAYLNGVKMNAFIDGQKVWSTVPYLKIAPTTLFFPQGSNDEQKVQVKSYTDWITE